MGTFRDLIVFQKSYRQALDIYEVTKKFPEEEKFGITNQIRRSSRSVCANFVECYRRRDYKKHFVSKLSDCLAENSDTGLWLEFSRDLGFLTNELYETLKIQNEEVGRLLNFMIHNPEKFVWKS